MIVPFIIERNYPVYQFDSKLSKPIYPFGFNDEVYIPITDLVAPGVIPGRYFISNYGNIYNTRTGFLVSFHYSWDGYCVSSISIQGEHTKSFKVHRLVLKSFSYRPDCEELQVNHINSVRWDNRLCNLEWCTAEENTRHALTQGIYNKDNYMMFPKIQNFEQYKTFTDDQAKIICECLEKKMDFKSILSLLGYDVESMTEQEYKQFRSVIGDIKHGKSFKHISHHYNIPQEYSFQIFSNEQVEYICSLLEKGESYKSIIILLGYNIDSMNSADYRHFANSISSIKNRKRYTSISQKYNF